MDPCVNNRMQSDKHQNITQGYRKQEKGKFTKTRLEAKIEFESAMKDRKDTEHGELALVSIPGRVVFFKFLERQSYFPLKLEKKLFVEVKCCTFRDTFIIFFTFKKSKLTATRNQCLDISTVFKIVVVMHCYLYCVLE